MRGKFSAIPIIAGLSGPSTGRPFKNTLGEAIPYGLFAAETTLTLLEHSSADIPRPFVQRSFVHLARLPAGLLAAQRPMCESDEPEDA